MQSSLFPCRDQVFEHFQGGTDHFRFFRISVFQRFGEVADHGVQIQFTLLNCFIDVVDKVQRFSEQITFPGADVGAVCQVIGIQRINTLAFRGGFLKNQASALSMIMFLIIVISSAIIFYLMRDKDEAALKKQAKLAEKERKLALKAAAQGEKNEQ